MVDLSSSFDSVKFFLPKNLRFRGVKLLYYQVLPIFYPPYLRYCSSALQRCSTQIKALAALGGTMAGTGSIFHWTLFGWKNFADFVQLVALKSSNNTNQAFVILQLTSSNRQFCFQKFSGEIHSSVQAP